MRLTIRNLLLFIGLLFHIELWAAPIWSNAGQGGNDTLVGTIHLADKRLATLPEDVIKAIDNASIIAVELDLARLTPQQQQNIMLQYGMLPAATTLKQQLSENVYKKAKAFLSHHGVDIEQLQRMKPWLLALTMVQVSYAKLGLKAEFGVDQQILHYAKQQGKPIVELETFAEQMNFFNQLLERHPSLTADDLLMDTLDEMERFKTLPLTMLDAWLVSDIAMFESIYQNTLSDSSFDKAAEKVLIIERNNKWLAKLSPLFEQHAVMVAVGTLHLIGQHGLPRKLQFQAVKAKP